MTPMTPMTPTHRPDAWDLTPLAIVPHSRLYHLEPMGRGTPQVESLLSYLVRLADAHAVPLATLIRLEVAPRWTTGRPLSDTTDAWTWAQNEGHSCNGTGPMAAQVAHTLAQLTAWPDLHLLTMLPWGGVLATQDLLRRGRAQCPACAQEQIGQGQAVYEPLLWSLKVVTICPHHRQLLHPLCFRRDCRPTVVWSDGEVVRCQRCRRGLMVPASERLLGRWPADQDWRVWVAERAGELIAAAPTLVTAPAPQQFAARLRWWTAQLGGVRALAHQAHVNVSTVKDWRAGRGPTLEYLLRLCAYLGTTPLELLEATGSTLRIPGLGEGRGVILPPEHLRQRPRPLPTRQIQTTLTGALTEEPPPPLRAVAQRLGYPVPHLRTRFPALCQAVAARCLAQRRAEWMRRKQEIEAETRQAMHLLHAQGLYPSARRVVALMPHPCSVQHRGMNAVRVALLPELGWERRNWNKWYRRHEEHAL